MRNILAQENYIIEIREKKGKRSFSHFVVQTLNYLEMVS